MIPGVIFHGVIYFLLISVSITDKRNNIHAFISYKKPVKGVWFVF